MISELGREVKGKYGIKWREWGVNRGECVIMLDFGRRIG